MNEADRVWLIETIRSTVNEVVNKVVNDVVGDHLALIVGRLDGIDIKLKTISTRLEEMATREELDAAVAELKEMLYDCETRLLTEFHKWAGPADQKMRSRREALSALDLQ